MDCDQTRTPTSQAWLKAQTFRHTSAASLVRSRSITTILSKATYAEDQANRDPLFQTGNLYDEPFNRHFVAGADGSEIYDGFGTVIDYDSAMNRP